MFFMQAPDLKQTGKNPLPLIKKRRWQMRRRVMRGQRREEKRTGANLRRDRNKREGARKRRQAKKKVRQGLMQ